MPQGRPIPGQHRNWPDDQTIPEASGGAGVSVRFLHGDCRELLQQIEGDVIITDPVWPNCPPQLLIGADRQISKIRRGQWWKHVRALDAQEPEHG